MKAAHNTAVSSNEKIFPVFARKLASKDTKDFLNTARKLAVWLSSEKAYYPAARPKVGSHLTVDAPYQLPNSLDCRTSRGGILFSASRCILDGYRFSLFDFQIALSAFMDSFIHHPAVAELAEHLQQLVQAIVPFKHLFPENELQC